MAKVLGMGNALVDILVSINDDQLLNSLNLPKGSMQLVNKETTEQVLNASKHFSIEKASGGSAANTIHGLASLDIKTGFLGKIGTDAYGQFFKKDMVDNNITTHLLESTNETGQAIALISPDSERTFATFLGAAIEMTSTDLKKELFQDYSILHIEGYLVQNQELIETAIKLAKECNLKISLDLASFNVVEDNLDFLKRISKEYVDILFANEEEGKAFTGKDGIEALSVMAQMCETAIFKQGKDGALIQSGKTIVSVNALDTTPIDTTGAGDLFAAGFLYGLINNFSIENCGKTGSILAGHVIEVVGPKIDQKRWATIKSMILDLK